MPEGRRGLFLKDSSCLCKSIPDINKCYCEIDGQRYQCYCAIAAQWYQCYCEIVAQRYRCYFGVSGKRVCCVELKDFHCAIPELCLKKKNRPLRRFATPPLTLGRKVINTLLCRGWGNTSLSSPKLGEEREGRRGLFLRDSSCLCISIPDINKCSCEIDAQWYQCYYAIDGQWYQCYCGML